MKKKKFKPDGVLKFVVKDEALVKHFWQVARDYQHIANMYIMLRDSFYETYKNEQTSKSKKVFQLFTNRTILRAMIKDREGGKFKEKVEELKGIIPSNDLYSSFKHAVGGIQIKNFYKLQHKINTGYKSFFTKLANGDPDAKPPQPKKLVKVHRVTIPIDQDCLSLKKEGFVRVNVKNKMVNIPISHTQLKKAIGDLGLISSAELTCTCNEIEIAFIYTYSSKENGSGYQIFEIDSQKKMKCAGLDLGIKNLASIFIDDLTSKSLVVSGKDFIAFNAKSNRKIAKLSSQKQYLLNQIKLIEKQTNEVCKDSKILEEKKRINRMLSKAYGYRNRFFYTNFNKLANRILEQISIVNVTHLYVSRNLGNAKQDPNAGMGKKNNQKFYQIPIISLLNAIERKAADYGVKVHCIDEAYTSKTSCLSGDVVGIQEQFAQVEEQGNGQQTQKTKTKEIDFGGYRKTRSQFKDRMIKKIFHADLNAAANHIKIGMKLGKLHFLFLKDFLWKLGNPLILNASKCFLDKFVFV